MKDNYMHLCVMDEDENRVLYFEEEELIKHVHTLPDEDKVTQQIPVDILHWSVEPAIDLWEKEDEAYHEARIEDADLFFAPVIYNNQVLDGTHRICKAKRLGLEELTIVRINSIPPLKCKLKGGLKQAEQYIADIQFYLGDGQE